MPRRNPTHSTKVNDPHSIVRESAGPVASDALAAESEGFSENRNSEALGVSGSNSTFANTDTSGATRLHPASDAEARMAQEDWAEEKKLGAAKSYPDALGGQSKGLAGEDTTGSGAYSTGGFSGDVGTAPSYINSQYVDESGPKGKNLTEGGFEGNPKNASFNQDIGGRNDPGRLAEEKFQRSNAAGGDARMTRQEGDIGENVYETLDRDRSA